MLTREKICEILDIEANGVCVYEMKNWPQIKGFIPSEALKRLCDLSHDNS